MVQFCYSRLYLVSCPLLLVWYHLQNIVALQPFQIIKWLFKWNKSTVCYKRGGSLFNRGGLLKLFLTVETGARKRWSLETGRCKKLLERMIMVQYLSYPVFSLSLSSVSEEGSNRAFFGLDGRNSSSSEMSPSPSSFALLLLSFPADDSCDSLIEACSAASKSFW